MYIDRNIEEETVDNKANANHAKHIMLVMLTQTTTTLQEATMK